MRGVIVGLGPATAPSSEVPTPSESPPTAPQPPDAAKSFAPQTGNTWYQMWSTFGGLLFAGWIYTSPNIATLIAQGARGQLERDRYVLGNSDPDWFSWRPVLMMPMKYEIGWVYADGLGYTTANIAIGSDHPGELQLRTKLGQPL
jgi:hypothetical protein